MCEYDPIKKRKREVAEMEMATAGTATTLGNRIESVKICARNMNL